MFAHGTCWRGLYIIPEAVELPRDNPRIAFLMVDDEAERGCLVEPLKEKRLDNVRGIGRLTGAVMPGIWAASNPSLIVLRRNDLFKKVLLPKIFEAMAMSYPIIPGIEGEARQLLGPAGAELAAAPASATELAAAVVELVGDTVLAAQSGERRSRHMREHYNRARLAAHSLELLQATAAERAKKSSRQSHKGGRVAA